jgi:HJR/Mrr/RecB family endonuclease
MVYVWGFWAIIRIILFFNPESISKSLLIPEPLNTILFFAIGFILIVIWIGITYWRRSRTRNKAFGLSSEGLLNLHPADFEEMVAELYRAMGHQAKRTGMSGDYGVDVVVKAKTGEKWVVQCKRWRTPAGESIVRDFYGTMQHEKAAQGAIVATSGFSQAAMEWAKGKPLYLYNGNDFLRLWEKVKKQQNQETKAGYCCFP